MRTRSLRRSIAAATTALALASAGALLVPSAAFADSVDISTDSILWSGVNDMTGYIEEAERYDVKNRAYGWNYDSFDGFPSPFTLTDPDKGDWQFIATTSVSDIVEGGKSVITMTGSTTEWADPYTVVLTLTLQGNYAHWAYAVSNPTIGLKNSSVSFTGDIGSDDDSEYVVNGNTLVSDDTGIDDPIIGYNAVTDGTFGGWTVDNGRDNPEVTAAGAAQFEVYLLLYGYTPCQNGFATAKSLVTNLVPTLPATFGERYNDAGTCITVTPLTLTRGVPVNEVLAYTIDAALTTTSRYIQQNYFTDLPVSSIVDDLPAGLTATSVVQPNGSIIVTISGTPTTSGTFTSRLLFAHQQGEGGEDLDQILGSITITVADPAVAAVPVLPATGVDATSAIGLGGALLLAGFGLVFLARRRLV